KETSSLLGSEIPSQPSIVGTLRYAPPQDHGPLASKPAMAARSPRSSTPGRGEVSPNCSRANAENTASAARTAPAALPGAAMGADPGRPVSAMAPDVAQSRSGSGAALRSHHVSARGS